VSDFLLEIGVENLPASYVRSAFEQLRADAAALLDAQRLDHGGIYTTGAPRRLVLVVSALSARQRASEEVVTGPPAARAFDDAGEPTAAAQGFARAQGVSVAALERIDTPKGVCVGVRRKLPRRPAAAILREHLPGLVAGLRFPKTMKWEPSGARFARPVRWMVAMVGARVVRFTFAGVTSGNRTYRRPWMAGEGAVLRSSAAYETTMRKLGILVDHQTRRARIEQLARTAASRRGWSVVEDEALLEELTFMLEDPRPLVGAFPESYLALPPEVVTTAMRSHQRYLALRDRRKRLVARFITFTDGAVTASADVRRGNERVLRARLEDASFYWREDLKRGVDGLSEELDRIVFVEGLGTIGQKWRRTEALALAANAMLSSPVDAALVKRAVKLAKADLASEMIKDGKEFTLLQGVIGSHYAREAGEDAAVVAAIREHHQPRGPADPVPRAPLSVVLGVADRTDTIAGCFIADIKPSGSQDPYGLRRAGNAIVRLVEPEPGVALDALADAALQGYARAGLADEARVLAVRGELVDFLQARVDAFLKERSVPYDVAAAVTPPWWRQPGLALAWAREIARMRGNPSFERLITGVKRVGNILAPSERRVGVAWDRIEAALSGGELAPGVAFDPGRFEEPVEGALLEAVRRAAPTVRRAEESRAHPAVLEALSGLAGPIDAYFDGVLVNCEDPALRANHHRFLAAIHALLARYADFSEIVEGGPGAPNRNPRT